MGKICKVKQNITNKTKRQRNRKIQKVIQQRRNDIVRETEFESHAHENTFNSDPAATLRNDLRSWVNRHGITTRAVNDLLRLLNESGVGNPSLPKDYRTLLQTPKTVDIIEAAGGMYWYHGIETNLRLIFIKLNENISIELNFNMDGLPIYKSSQRVFWPVLCSIYKMPHIRPIIVSIWCGTKKPNNLTEYLRPLINELKILLENGIFVNGYHISITFRCCICDSPARALIKGTVNFNHTFGCQKCVVKGSRSLEAKRMFYPEIGCALRTDDDFRNRKQPIHHKEYSLFEDLPIDMVTAFPTSDPLHLLELGIMKRLLKVWIFGDIGYNQNWRKWSKAEIIRISNLLLKLNEDKPLELHRSVRSLNDFKYWKGTEFRSFLLYFGIVVLKEFLPEEVYEHFLILVCATTICYTDVYKEYVHITKSWFEKYVDRYKEIYSTHSLLPNVHLLTHIYDDVINFGNLNDISAYPFENRLHFLKMRLKQPNLPLEQITRRIIELSFDSDQLHSCNIEKDNFPQFKHSDILDGNQIFKEVIIDPSCTFSSIRKANSWLLTFSLQIIQMEYVIPTGIDTIFHGRAILNRDDFFSHPVSSRYLNTFKSDGDLGPLMSFKLTDIKAKMIRLTCGEIYVFMPLLHTIKKQ